MKNILCHITCGFALCISTYAQTLSGTARQALSIDGNARIPAGTTFVNNTEIRIRDTLFIDGTLENNRTISARVCVVNGKITATSLPKTNMLTITESLIFKNATISKKDNIHYCSITAKNISVKGTTNIDACELKVDDMTVEGTLDWTGKTGVKTVLNSLSIVGSIHNSGNENVRINGTVHNLSSKICSDCNFDVIGPDCHLYGDFSCYRLALSEGTMCTNHGSLTVTDNFSGKGTFIQGEQAYITIKTKETPLIEASALGNCIELANNGVQNLNASTCYSLVLSKERSSIVYLQRNCTIVNSLSFTKNCFLHCNGHRLELADASQDIVTKSFKNNKGIILGDGQLIVDKIPTMKTIGIPLFTTDKIYAGLQIQNLDSHETNVTIDSLFSYVTETGSSQISHLNAEFVGCTWHITSTTNRLKLQARWDESLNLPIFDPTNYCLYMSNGKAWKKISDDTQFSSPSYISIGNAHVILASDDLSLQIESKGRHIIATCVSSKAWKDLWIEESDDGLRFHAISTKTVLGETCSIYPNWSSSPLYYYRIVGRDRNGKLHYSSICSIQIPTKEGFVIDKQNQHLRILTACNDVSIYHSDGRLVLKTKEKDIDISHLRTGIYIICISSGDIRLWQKIAL